MRVADNSTPLIALDAVAIDLETTGLDPRKAWVVEMAAVRLERGRVLADSAFFRRVRPREPIPPAATAVQGIDDAAVATAGDFAEAWPDFARFVAYGSIVLGHAIGFDLAVIERECQRSGLAWTRPRTLDTLLLAEIALPALAEYSLDSLATFLGIEIEGRHSAFGDAQACAQVFLSLVPRLRERGIGTLAEAERACRTLTDVLDQHHRAGWIEPVEAPVRADREAVFSRIDSYAYRHRVGDIMHAPPRMAAADASVGDALQRMIAEGLTSLLVHAAEIEPGPVRPAELGIVTERDLLRVLARDGAAAFTLPLARVMSRPLVAVPAEAFVYRAIGRMDRLAIRHLGVTDEAGCVGGEVSARDLLSLRAGQAVALGDAIDEAEDDAGLARAWATLPRVVAALHEEKVSPHVIAAVISQEIGALTRQAAVIAERRMRDAGLGEPPCAYAVAVLGSAGRSESLLAMDQDNAIFFAQGEPDGPEDRWFGVLGTHIAETLNQIGLPFCKGGVMGRNARWRGSTATWRDRIAAWVRRSKPRDLMYVDIFFDLRAVHGLPTLASDLRDCAFDMAKGEMAFAKLLVESAGPIDSGLNVMGAFRTEQGCIDLKRKGTFPIVTSARALAIRHHLTARSTPERLAAVRDLGIGGRNDLDLLIESLGTFMELVLAQQLDDLEQGVPASQAVAIKRLTAKERARLRTALKAVTRLDWLTRDLLFND